MYGILLMLSGTLFGEFSSSLGKQKVHEKKETIFTMGFLNTFFVAVFFLFIIIVKPDQFVFSFNSLPTFLLRVVLEIILAHVSMLAITRADRSTWGFLRVLTLPLLLIADLFLGYYISGMQLLAIGLIIIVLLFLFINHGIDRKGSRLVLFTAFLAVITISLYKYNITHFNSVVAEQFIVILCMLAYFMMAAKFVTKEHPLKLLKKKIYLFQSLAGGIRTVLESFAYMFAPASIIMAAKRSSVVMWSMISGNVYFKEKKAAQKFVGFIFLVVAIILLTLQ